MKCFAEFEWGGKWRRIVSAYRPLLCAVVNKMYSYELIMQKVRAYGRKDIKTVIDVGACIGGYSIIYSEAFPEATIYAIEPASINWDDLLENVAQFPNIVPAKIAAWDKNEEVQIALTTKEQKDFLHSSENTGQISVFGDTDIFRERVPARRLDDLFEEVDFIKVDAEGADLKVLQGAERLIRECRPILQLEMMPPNLIMAGSSLKGLLEYVIGFNYGFIGVWLNDFVFAHREYLTEEEKERIYQIDIEGAAVGIKIAGEDVAYEHFTN